MEYEIIVPKPEETLYNPQVGCICLHEQTFGCGFRVPLIEPIQKFFKEQDLCPTQVLPKLYGGVDVLHCGAGLEASRIFDGKFFSTFKISSVSNSLFYFF